MELPGRPLLTALLIAVGTGLVVWLALTVAAALPGRVGRLMSIVRDSCRSAAVTTSAVASALVAVPDNGILADGAERATRQVLVIALVACTAWLTVQVLVLGEQYAYARLPVDVADNRRRRRARTRVTLMRRVLSALAVVAALGIVLMSFEGFRTLGVSLLASAGVAGAIVGLAAQTTLTNVFAGLQLAFTDAVRIDDVVVVEGEWGWIEELTLTYVVLHIWDERRLVLPTSYFTMTPFQNWTRTEARVVGSVVLHLDYAVPVAALRERAREVVEASPLWDRKDWVLQVVDTTPSTMVVRVLASAADAPSSWDLRCDVREQLLDWVQREHPGGLPKVRLDPGRVSPADRSP